MIKFFRKIRQRLVTENKFNKYLLYAIGEIILVVIGILIALQINNWNEHQKQKDYEITILDEIRANLITSKKEVELAIEDDRRWRACIIKILDFLDEGKAYNPNLNQCFGSYYWSSTVQFSTSSYEELKAKGMEIISNIKLRRDLTTMYDFKFDVIETEVEVWDSQLLSSTIYPLHTKLFRKYFPDTWSVFEDEFARPNDYKKLLDNDEYKNLLSELISLRNYSIKINELLKNDLNRLIKEIEIELIMLKK
ncbi:MAG: hypothetical protein KJO41_11970 [Bacteroidia bacterium]|nr:hypothetical protein [Bacteroidia bacterium]MBT8279711.1 hypothetical protein [Bacteroidia bacterium]NND26713.1 hypothetical protein [Flavobacteriaceae bacterium]NNL32642.1 hypothetical protein [Flavobacteriaceae bacterium]